ncbi:hypothetical protein Fmac_013950 [Flemingia macrophylla]|uniref:RING-type E3 ubiquitin transferase n=1 Tax=Flemingia macrophylla TaxID=520843 RepID=A0ABD1MAF8_9FABA
MVTGSLFFVVLMELFSHLHAKLSENPTTSSNPDTMCYPGTRNKLIVIMVVAYTGTLFLIFLNIHISSWLNYRNSVVVPAIVGCQMVTLSRKIVEKCPIFVYAKLLEMMNLVNNMTTEECAVCLEEFEDNDTVRMLPQCKHFFHWHCINSWLPLSLTCPICRHDLTLENVTQVDNFSATHSRALGLPIEEQEQVQSIVVEAAAEQPETEHATHEAETVSVVGPENVMEQHETETVAVVGPDDVMEHAVSGDGVSCGDSSSP